MHTFPWEGDRRWQTICPGRVGFWHSAADLGYRADDTFLETLALMEGTAERWPALGTPKCRLCGHLGLPIEYSLGCLVWPDLYKHYIGVHGVRPHPDFLLLLTQAGDWTPVCTST